MKRSRILQKLGIEPSTSESFRFFITSLSTILRYCRDEDLESLKTWDAPVLPSLCKLSGDETKFIESELPKVKISIHECQVQVQKLIPQDERKRFAAYYTIDQGIGFMASIVYEYLKNYKRRRIVLADPFLGSARTLTVAIRKIGADKLRKVWGIEPLPLPALIAYASLLQAMRGKKDTITVITGDAFREVPRAFSPFTHSEPHKADVILTNPPFTRWKCLERGYRDYLLEVVSGLGYGEYITRREASLQTLAMFLADYILTNGGLIGSVLPASTFYTIYGRGYKSLLRKNYETLAVVESASRPSFSEDSGFKEIIIAAIKGNRGCGPTLFVGLDNNAGEIAKALMNRRRLGYRRNSFDIRCLPRFLDI
ncbi:MAG: N-6 DNA methylase, partial [Candidatus Freyarchaeota archaeon]